MLFYVLLPGKDSALCGNVDVRGEFLHSETNEAEREQSCDLLESKCQISCEIKADLVYHMSSRSCLTVTGSQLHKNPRWEKISTTVFIAQSSFVVED